MNNLTYFNYSYTCMYKYFMLTKHNYTYLCKSILISYSHIQSIFNYIVIP